MGDFRVKFVCYGNLEKGGFRKDLVIRKVWMKGAGFYRFLEDG